MTSLRTILIVDSNLFPALGNRTGELATRLNNRCRSSGVRFVVGASCVGDSVREASREAAVVFLHHNNFEWDVFARAECTGKDLVLTSSSPKRERLDEISADFAADRRPRLLELPLRTFDDWNSLHWEEATAAWKPGAPFPLEIVVRLAGARDTLTALAILCQGYLAAHARQEGPEKFGPPEIEAALRSMRWPQYWRSLSDSKRAELGTQLASQRGEVRTSGWWSKVIPANELKHGIQSEWTEGAGVQTDVLCLADSIASDSEITPLIVNAAYQALCAQLAN